MKHAARADRIAVAEGVSPNGRDPLLSAQEVADYLRIDVTTTRRLFADQAGVIQLGRPQARGGRRRYCTLRIPLSVLRAFIQERKK
jgi:hypothetical protein